MGDKAKYIFWGKAILIALLLVFALRTSWVEPYLISSAEMKEALLEGDRVIVDKTAYGLRLPITVLSIPFTFDRFCGLQSYSSALQLPYTRIGNSKIPLNDVVVYNHPLQTDRPLDKRVLCVGRCVGQPGDTILIHDDEIEVNGHHYETIPNFKLNYSLPKQWQDSLRHVLKKAKLSALKMTVEGQKIILSLNTRDIYILREHFADSLLRTNNDIPQESREVVIPHCALKVKLDAETLNIYGYLIRMENRKDAVIREGKLYLRGKPVEEYTFKEDYYWLLADNQNKAIDSRHIGFIPYKNIVGKATLIWFSSDGYSPRWERIFSTVR